MYAAHQGSPGPRARGAGGAGAGVELARGGKALDDLDVLRHFEVRDLAAREVGDLFGRERLARLRP